MNGNDDEWVASIASFIRNNFGNQASFVSAADVARVRAKTKSRANFWTVEELESRGADARSCRTPAGRRRPATTPATRCAPSAGLATAGTAGRRRAPGRRARGSRPGMWFTVDMSAPATVAEIHFDSPAAFAGQGGRRAGAAAGAGGPAPAAPGRGGLLPAPAAAPGGSGRGARRPRRPAAPRPAGRRGPGWRRLRRSGRRRAAGRRVDASRAPTRSTSRSTARSGACRWRAARARRAARRSCSSGRCAPATSASRRPATDETAPAWSVARLQVYGPAGAGPAPSRARRRVAHSVRSATDGSIRPARRAGT